MTAAGKPTAYSIQWFEDAQTAIRSGDLKKVRALGPVPRKNQELPAYLMTELLDGDRPDILQSLQEKGLALGTSLRLIFQTAIENPAWRSVTEADLERNKPDISKLLPVEGPFFARAPDWVAKVLRLLVRTWPDQASEALYQACSFRDLPRIVLFLAAGLRPDDFLFENCSFKTQEILRYGLSGHAQIKLTSRIGSLESLLGAPVADQVRELWPDYPIFSPNQDD